MNLPDNNFITKATVGFFTQGLSRGAYGLEISIKNSTQDSKVFEAVKTVLETKLPSANKPVRIHIPSGFSTYETLSWLLKAFTMYGFRTQIVFHPDFGSPAVAELADWRILATSNPEAVFIDFDELWFSPTEEVLRSCHVPLWPIKHPVYLYVDAKGYSMESVVGFMEREEHPWATL